MSTDLATRPGFDGPDLSRFAARRPEPQSPRGARVAVLAARFNAPVVDLLVEGALAALAAEGLSGDAVTLVRVAGAWELPPLARALAAEHAAVIALGCVIRGETSHYDVIVGESARGLMQVAVDTGVPVANGVLACEDEAQAFARAGGAAGNKGEEAARAALECVGLLRALR